jgi:hypothetical protein
MHMDFRLWPKPFQKPCKTHAELKRAAPRSWPDHGGTTPAQHRIYPESACPAEKAWRKTIRQGAPLQPHVFLRPLLDRVGY